MTKLNDITVILFISILHSHWSLQDTKCNITSVVHDIFRTTPSISTQIHGSVTNTGNANLCTVVFFMLHATTSMSNSLSLCCTVIGHHKKL